MRSRKRTPRKDRVKEIPIGDSDRLGEARRDAGEVTVAKVKWLDRPDPEKKFKEKL